MSSVIVRTNSGSNRRARADRARARRASRVARAWRAAVWVELVRVFSLG